MSTKILVVDDDRNLALLYRTELTAQGWTVDVAQSPSEALNVAQQEDYQVIILDIEMPDMSGLELLGKLREQSTTSRIILNSAFSTYKSDFQTWLADAYLVKSSDTSPLIQTIKNLLVPAHE